MKNVASDNSNLSQHGKVLAEYIFVDKSGQTTRSKCKVLASKPKDISDLPAWSYDGSSTGQAVTENSEVVLNPVAMYPDPFRGGDNILVMCDAWTFTDSTRKELVPADTNFRNAAKQIHEKVKGQELWFAMEQEYTLFNDDGNANGRWPLGWPTSGFPEP